MIDVLSHDLNISQENYNLTSKDTAHIAYGGSYAGAFVAFLRVLYPETFWGSISSSGVTKAIYDYWAYYEPVATYGPPECIATLKTLTHVVDNILIGKKNDTQLTQTLKSAFGLGNLTESDDFGNQLSSGVGGWQSLNWDPEVTSNAFYSFCSNLTSTDILYPETASLNGTAAHLISAGGYDPKPDLVNNMLNYIGYLNLTTVSRCSAGRSQDECFSNHNASSYAGTDLSDYSWRSWAYQYCSEWGFLQTGSGVPKDQLSVISRTIDLEYTSLICKYAFNITEPSETEAVCVFRHATRLLTSRNPANKLLATSTAATTSPTRVSRSSTANGIPGGRRLLMPMATARVSGTLRLMSLSS